MEKVGNDYQIVVKKTHSNSYSGIDNSWEVLTADDKGIINWENSLYVENIHPYEVNFNQDIDADGNIGINTSQFLVATEFTTGVHLLSNTGKNLDETSIFLINDMDAGKVIGITEEWGADIQLASSATWDSGQYSHNRAPVAVTKANDGGYVVAIKNVFTENVTDDLLKTHTDWEIIYTNEFGVQDHEKTVYVGSIKSFESNTFNVDLDGDGSIGINTTSLKSVETDKGDVQLMRDGETFYLDDNGTLIEIKDQYGSNPQFDFTETLETDDYYYSHLYTQYAA